MTTCTRCLFTSDFAHIHEDGECEYCKLHDALQQSANPADLSKIIGKVRRKGRGKKYDCLIGISGGMDSSTLLYWAVNQGLRPLVIHFDNHWNAPQAKHNMNALIQKLGVDAQVHYVNDHEYKYVCRAFLAAGLPDADIPNDIAMTKIMYDVAERHGIKYILNGHDFRTEGSTPKGWTYMDAKYIQSVYEWFTCGKLSNFPLFTFWDQIRCAIKGIKQVRPFHYMLPEKRAKLDAEMISHIGWQAYGGKHCENVYTEFVGSYLLPAKFQIDKRIVYLSARVRSGVITRAEAEKEMSMRSDFDFTKLGSDADTIANLIMSDIQPRENFARYNFKRYKFLIWILAKMKVVPWTFYVKYAK
jgi:hypothetical protein